MSPVDTAGPETAPLQEPSSTAALAKRPARIAWPDHLKACITYVPRAVGALCVLPMGAATSILRNKPAESACFQGNRGAFLLRCSRRCATMEPIRPIPARPPRPENPLP